MSVVLDCAIIGSGPAGLSAAINLHQRGKTVRVFGSAPSLLGKAEQVDNYPGLPAIGGNDLLETFMSHAASMGIHPETGKVSNILPMGSEFMLNFEGDIFSARSVILCAGVYRAAPLTGETEYLGRGVSYCATCDGMLYRDKPVVVWGLSSHAVQEADFLASLGCQVTFVSAKPPEGAHSFSFIKGSLKAVTGEQTVSAVQVNDQLLPCTGVFILRDAIAPSQLVPGLNISGGHVAVNRDMSTSIPGLFAAGDITGEPYQIAKAVGEGQVAALSAVAWLDTQNDK